MKPWEVLGDREVYSSAILRLHLERIRTVDGRETDWTVVDVGDGVAVLPVESDGSVWMIRQYRQAVGRVVWELPAGRVETDEDVAAAGQRELREEAGLLAAEMVPLGPILPLDGICRHQIHLYLARGLSEAETAHETFEDIEIARFTPEEFRRMIRSGELEDGIALAAFARYSIMV